MSVRNPNGPPPEPEPDDFHDPKTTLVAESSHDANGRPKPNFRGFIDAMNRIVELPPKYQGRKMAELAVKAARRANAEADTCDPPGMLSVPADEWERATPATRDYLCASAMALALGQATQLQRAFENLNRATAEVAK